jgi:hypothetical protein
MRRTHTRRRSLLALAGCLLVCTLAVQAGLAVPSIQTTESAETTENVSITVTNATVGDDGTTALQLSLSAAPNGLAGFQLTATLRTDGVASVTEASYPDRYGLTTEPVITADGQSVTLEAADLSGTISPGATDIPLATVVVSGDAAGETLVDLTDVQVDADGGSRVAAASDPGVVTVAADDTASSAESTGSASDGNPDTASRTDPASDGGASGLSGGLVVLTIGSAFLLGGGLLARRTR